jgi:hypothetical protein
VRAARRRPNRDEISFGDLHVDRNRQVRESVGEHREEPLDAVDAGGKPRRHVVAHELGSEELVDLLQVPRLEQLPVHAMNELLVLRFAVRRGSSVGVDFRHNSAHAS